MRNRIVGIALVGIASLTITGTAFAGTMAQPGSHTSCAAFGDARATDAQDENLFPWGDVIQGLAPISELNNLALCESK